MPASTLVLSRLSTLQKLPESATFSSLTIDGCILVDHLLDSHLRVQLGDVCKTINSLSINFSGCGERLTGEVLDTMFEFLNSLHKLRRVEFRNFTLYDPDTRPPRPACLDRSPLSVRELTIAHTHSTCLAYLMDCFTAHTVSLESCLWIDQSPFCTRLELYDILPFEDIIEILLDWDGDELIIDSCPFVDEEFVYELIQRMTATDMRVWPSARLSFEEYPYAIRRKLNEFFDVRFRL